MNNKDPYGYEQLDRYKSYKWVKYVIKATHIMQSGFQKVKWYYITATSANHAIDLFKAHYTYDLNFAEGEYMIIMGVYDKPNTMYVGDYKGNRLYDSNGEKL
jgi:hypothetical protein